MCQKLIIDGQECDTLGDLCAVVGETCVFPIGMFPISRLRDDTSCLCPVNLEVTVALAGLSVVHIGTTDHDIVVTATKQPVN